MDRRRKVRGERDTADPLNKRFGVLKTNLNAAAVIYGVIAPTNADVWLYDEQLDATSPDPELISTTEYVNVSNLNPDFSGIPGQACFIQLINGIWRFVWVQKTVTSGGTPCACCDCMTCIDPTHATIGIAGGYGAGWASVSTYFVTFGSWYQYPSLGGFDYLMYKTGALWLGRTRLVIEKGCCSYYQYEYFQDRDSSYVQLVWVDGCDALKLNSGNAVKWTAETNWSPLCNASFKAIAPETFPYSPLGLNCKICVEPIDDLTGGSGGSGGCLPCELIGYVGGLPSPDGSFYVTIPELTFATVPTSTTVGPLIDLACAFTGEFPASSSINPCSWWGQYFKIGYGSLGAMNNVGDMTVAIGIGANVLGLTLTVRALPYDPFNPYAGLAGASYYTPWPSFLCPFDAALALSELDLQLDPTHASSSPAVTWPKGLRLGIKHSGGTPCDDCPDCSGSTSPGCIGECVWKAIVIIVDPSTGAGALEWEIEAGGGGSVSSTYCSSGCSCSFPAFQPEFEGQSTSTPCF